MICQVEPLPERPRVSSTYGWGPLGSRQLFWLLDTFFGVHLWLTATSPLSLSSPYSSLIPLSLSSSDNFSIFITSSGLKFFTAAAIVLTISSALGLFNGSSSQASSNISLTSWGYPSSLSKLGRSPLSTKSLTSSSP